ncbi:hypothetical protein [Flavobacterium degerlachei]|jgi:hypothetical protein|uniref:Uncharacterized protein n=1 Tax=Flavobacterium degerlachei TaxID=229203 RepID=A0A1H2Y135_9FLAO|nr:hypothetical protein [Flavobacterium degerlachei]SDW98414.1 hypothetical protein SAMN05444338_10664 [Flavobacterium degerlachei]
MKTPKKMQIIPNLLFRQRSTNDNKVSNELVSPRFEVKLSPSFKSKKASNPLLIQMYSQENEILFI